VLQARIDESQVHRSIFHSLRVQSVYVLLFAGVVPLLVMLAMVGDGVLANPSTNYTLACSFVAAAIALLSIRRVGSFFGSVVSRWILPIYATCFAVVFGALVFFRLPYGTILMTICFATTLTSFYVLAALMVRGRRATCYIIPEGRVLDFDIDWGLRTNILTNYEVPSDPRAIVVADLHAGLSPKWERFLTEAALQGHPVYHYTQLREAMTGKVQFEHLSENSFGSLVSAVPYQKIKRLIDLFGVLLASPLLAPAMLVIAIVIRLDSDGPVLFRQKRMGFRGHLFHIVKFRTMTVQEDGEDRAASITHANDARVTRVGGFLRRTRLDELPQALNVIKGEMSWIGPRPEAVSLSMAYEKELAQYRYRHLVRPGITGWAQVHQGHVHSVEDVQEKLAYDFYYVKNISLWIDIVIALRTFRVIATGFGAR